MKRTQADYRWRRTRAIRRKLGILQRFGGKELVTAWTRGAHGRLAKGKIHCSCPMCRRKSSDNPSHRDKKAILSAAQQHREWNTIRNEDHFS